VRANEAGTARHQKPAACDVHHLPPPCPLRPSPPLAREEDGLNRGSCRKLARLLQSRTHVQRLVLVEFAPYPHPQRLPQGMGKERVLPVLDHRPIRDGPLRKPPWLGGLLHNEDLAAA
jgi:hypothetical protein